VTFVITEACVDLMERSCVRECPVDCIYEGNRQLYIHPDECIECGACEPVCPVEAIYYDGELPDEHAAAARRQESLFLPLGQLGGARQHGPLNVDHPEIADLPSK
jgi:NAD-dependent dihydropyrimidine dehydrogenase PreA subunit